MAIGGVEAFVGVNTLAVLVAYVANTELGLITDGDEGAVSVALANGWERLARGIVRATEVGVTAAVLWETMRLGQHAARVSRHREVLRGSATVKDHRDLARLTARRRRKGERSVVARRGSDAPRRLPVATPQAPLRALLEVKDVSQADDVVRFAA